MVKKEVKEEEREVTPVVWRYRGKPEKLRKLSFVSSTSNESDSGFSASLNSTYVCSSGYDLSSVTPGSQNPEVDLNAGCLDLDTNFDSNLDFSFRSVKISDDQSQNQVQINQNHSRSFILHSQDEIKVSFFDDSYIGLIEPCRCREQEMVIDQAIELSVKAREEMESAIKLLEDLKAGSEGVSKVWNI